MKWPIYLHSPTVLIGRQLQPEQKVLYEYLQKELRRYLKEYNLREEYLKDFVRSWNQLGSERFLPILHQVVKQLRHRLLKANAVHYHRLVHLVNALIRNGGTAAQALLGREGFLRTIAYCIRTHSASKQVLSNDTAALCFQQFKEWKEGLEERKDLFPFYGKIYDKLARKYGYLGKLHLGHMVLTNIEKNPVKVDEEYRLTSASVAVQPVQIVSPSSPSKTESVLPAVSSSGLSIAVPEDDESLNLNRVGSSIADTPLTITTPLALSSPTPKGGSSTKRRSGKSSFEPKFVRAEETTTTSSSKLIIVEMEEEEATVASRNNEDDLTVQATDFSEENDRMSVGTIGTIQYDTIFQKAKAKDEELKEKKQTQSANSNRRLPSRKSFTADDNNNNTSPIIRLSSSPNNKTINNHTNSNNNSSSYYGNGSNEGGGEKEKVDVSIKYFGTQRVVSYKRSSKNILSTTTSQQAIVIQQ